MNPNLSRAANSSSTAVTPPAKAESGPPLKFAIQEHVDGSHHYELELEHEGVLKTWLLPRGLPPGPSIRRLAIQVADRPLAEANPVSPQPLKADASGITMYWDNGTYKPRAWTERSIVFTIHGGRRDGTYALVKYDRAGPAAWLVFHTGKAPR